jgi:hypothetical protein
MRFLWSRRRIDVDAAGLQAHLTRTALTTAHASRAPEAARHFGNVTRVRGHSR